MEGLQASFKKEKMLGRCLCRFWQTSVESHQHSLPSALTMLVSPFFFCFFQTVQRSPAPFCYSYSSFLPVVVIKLPQLPFLSLAYMHVLPLSKKLIGSWEGGEMENCLCSLEGRVNGRVNIIPSPHVTEEVKTMFCN